MPPRERIAEAARVHGWSRAAHSYDCQTWSRYQSKIVVTYTRTGRLGRATIGTVERRRRVTGRDRLGQIITFMEAAG